MHESVQEVFRLALLQLLGGQGVADVQNVSGGGLSILRAHNQVHLKSEQLQLVRPVKEKQVSKKLNTLNTADTYQQCSHMFAMQ